MPNISDDHLWAELSGPRYTTPLLRPWTAWLKEAMATSGSIVVAEGFASSVGVLKTEPEELDALVASGVKGGHLRMVGLGLERELDRHARYHQGQVRERVQLPKLWAGFPVADAAGITGDGPELAAYAARTGRSPQRLLEHLRRDHLDTTCYPLAWVSHLWEKAVAVFADLKQFPRRQVFRLRQPSDDLVGYQGAAEFNFMESRSRQRAHDCNCRPAIAVACG
jgi:hypothetical protein